MNSRQNSNKKQQKMAPQNSTLINLVNDDDIKSISSERFSPIEKDSELFHHDSEEEEVRVHSLTWLEFFMSTEKKFSFKMRMNANQIDQIIRIIFHFICLYLLVIHKLACSYNMTLLLGRLNLSSLSLFSVLLWSSLNANQPYIFLKNPFVLMTISPYF